MVAFIGEQGRQRGAPHFVTAGLSGRLVALSGRLENARRSQSGTRRPPPARGASVVLAVHSRRGGRPSAAVSSVFVMHR